MYPYYLIITIMTFGLIIILWILYSNIQIKIDLKRSGEDDEISLSLEIFNGLIKFKTKIPFVDLLDSKNAFIKTKIESEADIANQEAKVQEETEGFNINEVKIALQKLQKLQKLYHHTIKYLYQRIVINKMTWITEIGTDDAAYTAILVGLLWAIKSNIIMYLKNNLKLNHVMVDVNPYYNHSRLVISFNCIVNIKVGYIIIAGIKFFLIKLRGGEKIERASN